MRKLQLLFATFVFMFLLTIPCAYAQDDIVPFSLQDTQVEKFQSHIVKSDYLLYISLPREYEKGTESYPIVFVLDADYCFPIVHQIIRFLSDHDEIKPAIVVGISHSGIAQEKYGPIHKLNRTRDYTPTFVAKGGYGDEFQKQSGGAGQFLNLFEKELIPYLEGKFRVKQDRTIVGYSFGGLFASYALLKQPSLFQRYIVVSPSLWYDRRYISRFEKQVNAKRKDLRAIAFFSIGSLEVGTFGRQEMVRDLNQFVTTLRARKYPSFHSQLWVANGEDHHSMFPGAAMRGVRFVFSRSNRF